MDFFAQQEQAHKQTGWLILLFMAAILCLITLASLIFALAWSISNPTRYPSFTNIPLYIHSYIALGLGTVILLATFYRISQLRKGGYVIATELGGVLISADSKDPDQRKLLNVIAEMALASGMPVPQVYLLDDMAINAFAAGFNQHDAAIGITRGAIELLDRNELQGVIAHEFSHILNGDMRLNLRLIGILYGISFVSITGYKIIRHSSFGNNISSKIMILLLGFALVILGYCGIFFANIIKASISRQREFLADASAVQFTRNPDGIANALKKIGGWDIGSNLLSTHSSEYSHLFIVQSINNYATGLFHTHPPLNKRIQRIDKYWNGQYPKVERPYKTEKEKRQPPNTTSPNVVTELSAAMLATAINQAGMPNADQLQYARTTLESMPEDLLNATREPQGAYAVALALMLHPTKASEQINMLKQTHISILNILNSLEIKFLTLDNTYRLPLLELCIPALKSLSNVQQQEFKRDLRILIKADNRFELWEWALHRIFSLALNRPEQTQPRYKTIAAVAEPCRLIIFAVAHTGTLNAVARQSSFSHAADKLQLNNTLPDKNLLRKTNLDQALSKIRLLRPLEKPKLLKALCYAAEADGIVSIREIELIRAIAESIDCPMPPLLKT